MGAFTSLVGLCAPGQCGPDRAPTVCTAGDTTPLHLAAFALHRPLVRLLREYGANGNAKDDRGRTPLRVAAEASAGRAKRAERTAASGAGRTNGGQAPAKSDSTKV